MPDLDLTNTNPQKLRIKGSPKAGWSLFDSERKEIVSEPYRTVQDARDAIAEALGRQRAEQADRMYPKQGK